MRRAAVKEGLPQVARIDGHAADRAGEGVACGIGRRCGLVFRGRRKARADLVFRLHLVETAPGGSGSAKAKSRRPLSWTGSAMAYLQTMLSSKPRVQVRPVLDRMPPSSGVCDQVEPPLVVTLP